MRLHGVHGYGPRRGQARCRDARAPCPLAAQTARCRRTRETWSACRPAPPAPYARPQARTRTATTLPRRHEHTRERRDPHGGRSRRASRRSQRAGARPNQTSPDRCTPPAHSRPQPPHPRPTTAARRYSRTPAANAGVMAAQAGNVCARAPHLDVRPARRKHALQIRTERVAAARAQLVHAPIPVLLRLAGERRQARPLSPRPQLLKRQAVHLPRRRLVRLRVLRIIVGQQVVKYRLVFPALRPGIERTLLPAPRRRRLSRELRLPRLHAQRA
jgi:hypothetical protein